MIDTISGLLLAALIGGITFIPQFRRAETNATAGNDASGQSDSVPYTMLGPPMEDSWKAIDDPSKDGWGSEVFSMYVEQLFDQLSQVLSQSNGSREYCKWYPHKNGHDSPRDWNFTNPNDRIE